MTRARTPVRATQCAADGQGRAGAVPCLRLAPCPAAAPVRSVRHVVVVGRVPRRLLFA
jgi:hypothetical protein